MRLILFSGTPEQVNRMQIAYGLHQLIKIASTDKELQECEELIEEAATVINPKTVNCLCNRLLQRRVTLLVNQYPISE